MDGVRIQYLINAYRNQQASPEERAELLEWYRDVSYQDSEYPDAETAVELRMLSRLLADTGYEPKRSLRGGFPWKGVAAAILILTFLGSLYFIGNWSRHQTAGDWASNDIGPGGNRATLVLTDGRTIDLSEEQSGIIIGDENITYQDGASLTGISNDGEQAEEISLLVLTTPKGGMYSVTLSDGTKVWLNAASTLKYPSRFDGNERVVELEGEAFFEVRKSENLKVRGAGNPHALSAQHKTPIPFIVKTPKQVVEVLGTQFNISAYAEDAEVTTTLVEGSVKVAAEAPSVTRSGSYPHDKDFTMLRPNQQSIVRNGQIVRNDVDVYPYVSWKDGKFSFEGKTFSQVMNELARWYAIEVIYTGKIPEIEFFGGAYRSNNLSLVLRIIESADLQYALEGRQLTISDRKKR